MRRKRRTKKVRGEGEEKVKRGPSYKRQIREIFETAGLQPAVYHAYEVGIKKPRLLRWLGQWSDGKVTQIEDAPVRVSARRKLVEIYPKARKPRDQRWIGALLDAGPEQSIILITECPHETLRGTQYCVPNDHYIPFVQTETKKPKSIERYKPVTTKKVVRRERYLLD